MSEPPASLTSLVATALDELRAGAALLRSSQVAFAARPTLASNTRWFMRLFVLRRGMSQTSEAELFWANLEGARDRCTASDAALAQLFAEHASNPAIARLQGQLNDLGQAEIIPALNQDVEPGEEAQASERLEPVVARMKVCEGRLLAAIQAVASQSSEDGADPD